MSAVEEREPAPAASSAAAGAQELNNPPELEEGPSSKKRGVRLEAGFAQDALQCPAIHKFKRPKRRFSCSLDAALFQQHIFSSDLQHLQTSLSPLKKHLGYKKGRIYREKSESKSYFRSETATQLAMI